MLWAFVFFGEEITDIVRSCNVLKEDQFTLNLFADSIFSDLDVTEAFSGEVARPENTGVIIIVDCSGRGHELRFKVQLLENMTEKNESFNTLISGIDFRFCTASGGDCLAFGNPVEGSKEPYHVSRERAGFEKGERRRIACWF